MKTIRDLFLAGYVRADQRTTIEDLGCNIAEHTEETVREAFIKEAAERAWWYPQEESIQSFMYIDEKAEVSFNHFRKLNDKFDDCSFIDDGDRDALSKIALRKAADGRLIYLGDLIICAEGVGRVVWLDSEFYVYCDIRDENVMSLNDDSKIIKLN